MDDLYDDLARFGDETPFQQDAPPPTCDGLEQANRLLARLAQNRRRQAEVEAVYDAERQRLDDWREDRVGGMEEEADWLRRGVEQFMRAHHAAGGGVTVKLPNGELRLRPSQLRLVTDDAAAFAKWAEEAGAADRLVRLPDPPAPKPDATAIKKELSDTLSVVERGRTDDGLVVFGVVDLDGVVVPGVTFVRAPEERTFGVALVDVTPPAQNP